MNIAAAATLTIGLLAAYIPALAAEHDHGSHTKASVQNAAWADGTVKRVNAEAGKVTIAHGPLPGLDMPPMTMVFRVKDPAWLQQMKPGDRIRMVVERVDGALTVTRVEPAR